MLGDERTSPISMLLYMANLIKVLRNFNKINAVIDNFQVLSSTSIFKIFRGNIYNVNLLIC